MDPQTAKRKLDNGCTLPLEWKLQKQYKIIEQLAVCTAEMIGIFKALETIEENLPILLDSMTMIHGTIVIWKPEMLRQTM